MLNHHQPVARAFHALADPSRIAIVERLTDGPASVREIATPLSMSLPRTLQHLKVLEDAGLVSSRKAGRVRTCRLEPKALRAAESWIAERRTMLERRLDRLEAFLAEDDETPED